MADIISYINQLRAKGLTDNQIIQTLQYEGHHPLEISQAIEMANRTKQFNTPAPQGSVPNMPPPQNPMQFQPQSVLNQQMQQPTQQNQMPQYGFPPQMPPSMMPPQQQAGGSEDVNPDEIEELIEAVIEEKWNDLKKNIDKIIAWKEQTDMKIAQIMQAQKDIRDEFDKVHNAVLGKVGDYDKNIKEVGAQLQAMEKIFSDVLPMFTQNVNTLNRITQRMNDGKQ